MANKALSIRHACQAFEVSQTCYRYQTKASEENARIADWLVRLTTTYRDWGFGLCFLHLRNVKGFGWNHKRVYPIYRELELNLRIKPKKRLVRERPEPLAVPGMIIQVWSMDFMQDQLGKLTPEQVFSGSLHPDRTHSAGQATAERLRRTLQPHRRLRLTGEVMH